MNPFNNLLKTLFNLISYIVLSDKKRYVFLKNACLGLAMPLGFAPFSYWGLLPLILALWILLLYKSKHPFLSGFSFGLGNFSLGLWWVSISLDQFGGSGIILASLGALLLAMILAIYYALIGFLFSKIKAPLTFKIGIILPLLWVLMEYARAHLFTGFPWLALGYSLVDSPFAALIIPKMGALLGSVWVIWLASLISLATLNYAKTLSAQVANKNTNSNVNKNTNNDFAYISYQPSMILGFSLAFLMWAAQFVGTPISISPDGHKVSAVQANIPQTMKFDNDFYTKNIETYVEMTNTIVAESSLIVWPESAIPSVYEDSLDIFTHLQEWALNAETTFIIGTFRQGINHDDYYNSVAAVNAEAVTFYDKARLLPFGEYMPLRSLLGFFERFVQIPMSDLKVGAAHQAALVSKNFKIGVSICFEAVFGNEMRYQAHQSNLLVNVSNDSWFGDSFAPWQHFQITRARVIEMARPMIRATSTGVSAILDHKGNVIATIPIYTQGIVSGVVYSTQGLTPYVVLGDLPWVLLFLILLIITASYIRITKPK